MPHSFLFVAGPLCADLITIRSDLVRFGTNDFFFCRRNAVTRTDVRDVLIRRDVSTAFNHHYSVKIAQVRAARSSYAAQPKSGVHILDSG